MNQSSKSIINLQISQMQEKVAGQVLTIEEKVTESLSISEVRKQHISLFCVPSIFFLVCIIIVSN